MRPYRILTPLRGLVRFHDLTVSDVPFATIAATIRRDVATWMDLVIRHHALRDV